MNVIGIVIYDMTLHLTGRDFGLKISRYAGGDRLDFLNHLWF
ncbi:hypothetical protein [Laspinema palackyanum]